MVFVVVTSLVYLLNYFHVQDYCDAFISIDTIQRIAPLVRHGCSLYRRDDKDDNAATEVQTINSSSQNFMMVVQFII